MALQQAAGWLFLVRSVLLRHGRQVAAQTTAAETAAARLLRWHGERVGAGELQATLRLAVALPAQVAAQHEGGWGGPRSRATARGCRQLSSGV